MMRMMFWGLLVHKRYIVGDPDDEGHGIWVFLIPDLLHTLLMADFIFLYGKKVNKETIQPMIKQT